jgi:hypothetical protein
MSQNLILLVTRFLNLRGVVPYITEQMWFSATAGTGEPKVYQLL